MFVISFFTNEVGMKKASWSSILVAVVLLALGVIAEAQQPTKESHVSDF